MIDLDAFCAALAARPFSAFTPARIGALKAWAGGDAKALKALSGQAQGSLWLESSEEEMLAANDDAITRRLLGAFAHMGADAITGWLSRRNLSDDRACFSSLVAEWEKMGIPRKSILKLDSLSLSMYLLTDGHQPTGIGAWVLALSDEDLSHLGTSWDVTLVFARHAPERAVPMIAFMFDKTLAKDQDGRARLAAELLEMDAARWLKTALLQLSKIQEPMPRLWLLDALLPHQPTLSADAEAIAIKAAGQSDNSRTHDRFPSAWIARRCGERAGTMLATAWTKPCRLVAEADRRRAEAVAAAIEVGNPAVTVALHTAATGTPHTAAVAIAGLAAAGVAPQALADAVRALERRCDAWLDDPTAAQLIERPQWSRRTLSGNEARGARRRYLFTALAQAVEQAGAARGLLGDDAIRWLGHEDSVMRRCAARLLAGSPAGLPTRLQPALSARAADTRLAAVSCLVQAGTPECLAVLDAMVAAERSDDVRDAIMTVLVPLWQRTGRVVDENQISEWIRRSEKTLAKPVAAWLDEKQLPTLKRRGGKTLTVSEVRWLCWRQARQSDIVADPEAAYLLLQVERSGEFAQVLLNAFLTSKQDAKDRWALTLVGVLGDDREVPLLRRQIEAWVQKSRGKLAEYGAQALALLGSDVALQAVDAVANAYRTKNRNVGSAANEAFTAAATRRGMTTDELGDAVVPWLGFTPGTPRTVAGNKKGPITVTVGVDGKLAYREGAKNTTSLPSGVDKTVKDEMKLLAAHLRDSLKAQSQRHARMLVQQRRWTAAAWWTLYGQHPVLRAFAVRLIWGIYDQQSLTRSFRVLEDGSLSDAHDDAVTLPADTRIGLVHPLELLEAERSAWRDHLTDHEIEQPVPQLERPIVRVKDSERTIRRITQVKGTSLNGMTFKGRAERLGWRRGSVVDAGGISSYVKSYPATGIDVIVGVESMFIGMGMEDSMTLSDGWFVRQGSVALGSYVYDEPSSDADARVVPFGEVPAIVYSETMADLGLIAGKTADADDE